MHHEVRVADNQTDLRSYVSSVACCVTLSNFPNLSDITFFFFKSIKSK